MKRSNRMTFAARRGYALLEILTLIMLSGLRRSRRVNANSLLLICTMFAFCGCEAKHNVSLRYTPTTAVESFSPNIQARRFAVARFLDSRTKTEIAKVGFAHKVITDDDPILFVSGAVVDVLRRAGLTVDLLPVNASESSTGNAVPPGYDALIIGRIKVLEVTTSTGGMKSEGRVALEYAIISSNNLGASSPKWSDAIIGQSSREWAFSVQFNEFSSLIDEALGRCLQKLVTDLQSGALPKVTEGGR